LAGGWGWCRVYTKDIQLQVVSQKFFRADFTGCLKLEACRFAAHACDLIRESGGLELEAFGR